MSTNRWVIHNDDVVEHQEKMSWKVRSEESEYRRFSTSPVRGAYWVEKSYGEKPFTPKLPHFSFTDKNLLTHPTPTYISEMFGKAPANNGKTMVFRRYENLLPPEPELDIFVQAFLGFEHKKCYKFNEGHKILNDAWTVNLRTKKQESDNIMMDEFLKGFAGKEEMLKKLWEDREVEKTSVDVGEEIRDLLKVYTEAEKYLLKKENDLLDYITVYMKRYVEEQNERMKVTEKLKKLKAKIIQTKDEECDDCKEEDDE